MKVPVAFKFFALGSLALIVISTVSAFAAGLSVPASNVGVESIAVSAEDIKPPACAGLYLTDIISGSGIVTGTAGNDLIIGSSGADAIDGLGGNDCIVGSGGDDQITGGDGNDVCLSGDGYDVFTSCEVEQ